MPWLVGLRDRALIGVMVYTFSRISAVVTMQVEDYFANGKRWWVRLQEKGGKRPLLNSASDVRDADCLTRKRRLGTIPNEASLGLHDSLPVSARIARSQHNLF